MFFVHSFMLAIAAFLLISVRADVTVTTTTTRLYTFCPCDTTVNGAWSPSTTTFHTYLTLSTSTSITSHGSPYSNSTTTSIVSPMDLTITTVTTTSSTLTTSSTSDTSSTTSTTTSTTATTATTSTTSTTASSTSCPTSGTFVLQSSNDNTYATLFENDSVTGANNIQFAATSQSAAAQFSFELDTSGTCVLSSSASGSTRSVVIDTPGEFVDLHYVYLLDASSAAGYTQSVVACNVENEDLSCVVEDQGTLQLYGGLLSIAAGVQDSGIQGTITVVEV